MVAIVFAAPLIKQTRAIALDVHGQRLCALRARSKAAAPRCSAAWCGTTASVPIVTYMATRVVALFGTAAVLELIFSWGGVSQFGLTAILRGDFAVVQGYALLMSLFPSPSSPQRILSSRGSSRAPGFRKMPMAPRFGRRIGDPVKCVAAFAAVSPTTTIGFLIIAGFAVAAIAAPLLAAYDPMPPSPIRC